MLPAGGQGALGIETREEDKDIGKILEPLNDNDSRIAITAERCFLRRLGGGCQAPVATLGQVQEGEVTLKAVVADPNRERILSEQMKGSSKNPEELGMELADKVCAMGFKKVSSSFVFENPCLSGRVYLVGAGPGDPGLISLKGIECISKADVIIYDRLVNKKLLGHVRDKCELVYMGKLPGGSLSQAQIYKMMAREARKGKTVVRLKGGDPFLFGRGGEEVEFLAENNIGFEIVPGISSALTAPMYAGIRVTYRKFN